ncbi:MAG: SDR family oxidoreductase [Hyphomicrobiaceae bacterium]|nr:SDR family oxidoreductase [Hyphomicrobiaceae bacterium]
MKLLIMGASRGIGLEAVKASLEAGHSVRAFARSAPAMPLNHERLDKIAGDALSRADVASAVAGVDAVIQVLGASVGPATVVNGTTLFSEATRVLVDAMQANGVRRLICVTGLGAGDSRDHLGPLYRLAFTFTLRKIYDDKDIQEQIVRRSGLDWTIARPGLLRDGRATGLYRALDDPKDWKIGPVRRADVALFLVDEAEQGLFIGKTPAVLQ